jgi:hypothetical protein
MSGMTGSEEKILSRVRMTTDGVWIGDSIYWPLTQLVTTLYRSL